MQDSSYGEDTSIAQRRLELEQRIEDEEDDAADLQETLQRTDAIATRMTQILSTFDERLIRLERTIAPVHKQMTKLTALHDNIDGTILQIELVMSYFDLAGREEAAITKGPREEHLQRYMDAVTRVRDAYNYLSKSQFRSADRAITNLRTLLATGLGKLEDLFRKTLNGISASTDLSSLPSSSLPLPPMATLQNLLTLSGFISGAEYDGLRYTDVVGTYISIRQPPFAKSIAPLAQAATIMAPRVQSYTKGSGAHIAYARALGLLAAAEDRVAGSALPVDVSPPAFAGVVSAAFSAFVEKCDALVARVKKAGSRGDYTEIVVLVDLVETIRKNLTETKGDFIKDAGRPGQEILDLLASCNSTIIGMLRDLYVEIRTEANKQN
ncbi:exocyst complex component exo70, partial [Gonapodya sp. JEL0774]